MIVVDASVAVKWFLREEETAKANLLLKGNDKLVAPEIVYIEVISAITKRYRLGEITKDTVIKKFNLWNEMVEEKIIHLYPVKDLIQLSFLIASNLKYPIYDCIYLALAQSLNVPIISSDKKFLNIAKSVYKSVRLL